ncbi:MULTISPECIES: hypothetical protein [unclassified Microcoleus]|uniref:hypothetical protein n=1 Tax=unclassified Microcoleus TaxID=2642155 RepID=UPI002FD66EBC
MSLFLTGRAMGLGFDGESQTIQSQASDLKQLKIGLPARDIYRSQANLKLECRVLTQPLTSIQI